MGAKKIKQTGKILAKLKKIKINTGGAGSRKI